MILPNDGLLWVYAVFGITIVVAWLLWLLFGKDDCIIPTDEYFAPNNLPPAEVGYIVDGNGDAQDCISMLIVWANKGYIELIEKNNWELLIIKKSDLPETAEEYEKTLFSGLFKREKKIYASDSIEGMMGVSTKQLKDKFYTTIDATRKKIRKKYKQSEETQLYTKSSSVIKKIVGILQAFPIALGMLLTLQEEIRASNDMLFLVAMPSIFFVLSMIAMDATIKKRRSMPQIYWSMQVVFLLIFVAVGPTIGIVFGGMVKNEWVLNIVAAISSIITGCFFVLINKRTQYSNNLLAKIMGLKQFIKTAERSRLQTLIYSNQNYFYDLLPYAYVLGETKTWGKRFEDLNIEPPRWYTNSKLTAEFSTTAFTTSLAHSMLVVQTNSKAPSSSSSSSGHRSAMGRR